MVKTTAATDKQTKPDDINRRLAVLLQGTWKDFKVVSITREQRDAGGTWRVSYEE